MMKMTEEERELNGKMRLLEKHTPEWDKLYARWCEIQRTKGTDNPKKPTLEHVPPGEHYNIKTKYL
jgi:hypothetical protein